jgi:hypothetical protein
MCCLLHLVVLIIFVKNIKVHIILFLRVLFFLMNCRLLKRLNLFSIFLIHYIPITPYCHQWRLLMETHNKKTASLSLCPPQGRGKQLQTDLSTEQTEMSVTGTECTARTFLVSLSNKLLAGRKLVLCVELDCGGEAGAKVQAVHVTPLEGVSRVVFGAI